MKKQRIRIIKAMLAGALFTVALSACASKATFPPVETTARFSQSTSEPVPTVIATTIKYAKQKYLKDADVAINLPEGVPARTYDKVFAKLGGGHPMMQADEIALHITEVRTRSSNAQVDLIYTDGDGFHQFVTVTLQKSLFEDYRVQRDRVWRLNQTEITVPGPNYVAPSIAHADAPVHTPVEQPTQANAEPTDSEPTGAVAAFPADSAIPH